MNNPKNIILRPLQISDAKRLAELCNNRKIWDNLRDFIPHPYSEENAREFIEFCQNQTPTCTFGIIFNGDLVGTIGLVLQTDIHRFNAELGFWIGEPFWGLGIGTKSVELISNYAFQKLNLLRIYAGVFEHNLGSQKVLEKAGFNLEAIFEKAVVKNNLILNEYRYSLLNNQFEI